MTVAESFVAEAGWGNVASCDEALDIGKQRAHAEDHRCAKSHSQGVTRLIYPAMRAMCEVAHMQKDYEVARVKAEIRRLMDRKGIKAKPLAKKAGLGETAVRDIFEREEADMRVGTLHKIAGALDVTVDDILGATAVAITGRVGAGGNVVYAEAPLGHAPRPPGVSASLEALEVDGSSMLPRYSSGDIVYISREYDGVQEEDVGDFCAVRLLTGETYIKQLTYGSAPGFFTLRSLNAEDIPDVELEWATPIIFVMPRAARRRLGF